MDFPEYKFFTTHIEVVGKTIRFDYWCNDASFAFKRITDKSPYSVIATSGTLSPIEDFEREIGVPFPIRFQGQSVINIQKQLNAFCVDQIGGKKINLSFQHKQNEETRILIGKYLLDMIRVIPEGVLVFFTSYFNMSQFIEIWAKNSILAEIKKIKKIFQEETGSSQEAQKIKNFIKLHK